MSPHNIPLATPEAQALLRAAQRDWKTVALLLQHPDAPFSSVCFHAQQYLEKTLKAVLVSNAIIFPRTHDLNELTGLCIQHGITLPLPVEQLTRLNPCAVLVRYQDLDYEVFLTLIDVDEIKTIIEALHGWLKEQLLIDAED